ncbi:MAG: GH3 auxin-responsive promoter family protein, partial [Flavobacteriaceae bacterium]
MNIIGNFIKGVINVTDKITGEDNPIEDQKAVLQNLLETAKDTSFGKAYAFEDILESNNPQQAFRNAVPYFDYNQINDAWWHKLHEGQTDVTWPGSPDYFALSSGTTGKTSKRIPVTDAMIDAIRQAGIKQVL